MWEHLKNLNHLKGDFEMKKFYGVKTSKAGNELLEIVNAENEREVCGYSRQTL